MWHHISSLKTLPHALLISDQTFAATRMLHKTRHANLEGPLNICLSVQLPSSLAAECVDLTIIISSLIKHCNHPSSSSPHFHSGVLYCGGGTGIQPGCYLPVRSPTPASALLGHRTEREVSQSHLRQRGSLLSLLPVPPEEHEWNEAGLPGLASDLLGTPQVKKPADSALWVSLHITPKLWYILKIERVEMIQ